LVVAVIDGDTVSLWCPGRAPFRARLAGYDSPEVFSPGCLSELWRGKQATWALRAMLWQSGPLIVTHRGTDRYGRALVDLTAGTTRIGPAMIAAGHGRRYGGERRGSWCA
jgi:endonuclease YncB( thermonuclease family)